MEVILWMTEDAATNGERNLASRAVRAFLVYFRGNEKANPQKANRWYKEQDKYLDEEAEVDFTDGTIMTHVQLVYNDFFIPSFIKHWSLETKLNYVRIRCH